MIRTAVLIFALLSACAGYSQTQTGNQFDANPALFTVMAAIQAAGFDVDGDSATNHPLRKQVRTFLAGRKLDCMDDLKKFMAQHHQRDANAELNQYISFALSLDSPPSFKFRFADYELPPDVAALRGLEMILPRFYEEAGIEQIWKQVLPAYEHVIDSYHQPVTESLLQATYYLRNPTSGYMGRRFQILIDLMGPPNQVQTRSYKDDYYVVVTSTPDLPISEIRYAYLHYLLDPLALKYSDQLEKKRGMADYAQAAPALDDAYKSDYSLLTTSSLVKAIESRLTRGDANRQALVDQALREGFVFTPAFAEGLVDYEKQVQAMRLYFPTLVAGIDLQREEKRLDHVAFAHERTGRKIRSVQPAAPPELTGPEKTLETAEDQYRARNLAKARETFLKVLQETSQRPMHARAYYGLARIAALEKNPELAEKLFEKTLASAPDPEAKSWAHVYLGRLASAAGERADAEKHYRAAIAVEGGSMAARKAAEVEIGKSSGKDK